MKTRKFNIIRFYIANEKQNVMKGFHFYKKPFLYFGYLSLISWKTALNETSSAGNDSNPVYFTQIAFWILGGFDFFFSYLIILFAKWRLFLSGAGFL